MNILLETKLYLPEAMEESVARSRLCVRLDQGLKTRLTLVSAPAGFGKTTAVAYWLRTVAASAGVPARIGWYTIDEQDNELARFVRYLVAAIRNADPTLLSGWADLEQRTLIASPDDVADSLVKEIAAAYGAAGECLILALDDYHLVAHPDIHRLIARLLRLLPSSVHLVMMSRFDPPIGIPRLRAQDQLTELRAADLSFTLAESACFLRAAIEADIEEETVTALWAQTEGWAAGLRLAAISLQTGVDQKQFVRSFAQNNNRDIAGYLVDQVLGMQPPEVHDFLLRTSVLDRFSSQLCAAVLSAPESTCSALIGSFERSSLFLVPLDDMGEWYRYHTQFRIMLHNRLRLQSAPEERAALHRRAAQWFAAQGFVEEALRHFQAAGDATGAADLLEQQIPHLLRRQQWGQSVHWLDLIALPVILQRPNLLLLQAWIAYQNSDFAAVRELVARVEMLLPQTPCDLPAEPPAECDPVMGQVQAFRVSSAFGMEPAGQTLVRCRLALRLLPPEYDMVRGHVMNFLAQAILTTEGYEAAVRALQGEMRTAGSREYTLRLLYAAAAVQFLAGAIDHLDNTAQQHAKLAYELNVPMQIQWSRFGRGLVEYERNKVGAAVNQLAAIFEHPDLATFQTLRVAALPLLEVYGAAKEHAAGEAVLAALWRRQQAHPATDEKLEIAALAAYWELLCGRPTAAAALIAAERTPIRYDYAPYRDEMLVRALHVLGQPSELEQAVAIAEEGLHGYRAVNDTRGQIRTLVLLAQTYWRQGRHARGLQALRDALDFGYALGWRRTYITPPELMGDMLHRLAREQAYAAVAGSLLAAIAQPQGGTQAGKSAVSSSDAPLLAELLSDRELEVLTLMQANLSNKEIAHRLKISPLTVRNHTAKIYGKLQVGGRETAIARAHELGHTAGKYT